MAAWIDEGRTGNGSAQPVSIGAGGICRPPLKLPSPKDAKVADTRITGVALTMILAQYFPAPRAPSVTDNGEDGIFTQEGRGSAAFHICAFAGRSAP